MLGMPKVARSRRRPPRLFTGADGLGDVGRDLARDRKLEQESSIESRVGIRCSREG